MRETVSHYRILEQIGAGGSGEVFKALDLDLKRTVALKFLSPSPTEDHNADELLAGEAQAAASLNHPNIATVYEIGRDNGLSFIAMEYVEGEPLDSVIEQRPFELSEAIDIAIQVAESLKAAHARGLIHCDIKSSNIRLTPEGRVKVLDYGLARFLLTASQINSHNSGTVAGTLAYMPPEQLRGEPLDERTDLFSFGVVLYEMLAGQKPFQGENRAALMRSVLEDEPPPMGRFREDAPLELESIIRRSLEKNAGDRYATAEELLADLRRVMRLLENSAQSAGASIAEAESHDISESARAEAELPAGFEHKLRALAWRYRKWLRGVGLIAAALAIIQPAITSAGSWITTLLLSSLAAACLIAYAILRRTRITPIKKQTAGMAFRGLVPFQEADRDRFYGRETDTQALLEKVTHSEYRFGVLFGESGCGKTSLVRAGLLPRLWEEGYAPIYCRSYKDPLESVMDECRRRSQLARREGEPPIHYLGRVIDNLGGPLVIVLDQFEEFFVNLRSSSEREPFVSFVAECQQSQSLSVKFLLSMRSDFLYLINDEFAERIAEPLSTAKLYHLKNFDERRAAEIIEQSARRAGLPFERDLSRAVASNLAEGGNVLPSELQIVGERLQSRRIFTIEEYRRAGGKESLVHSFLEDVIQASGDREGCCLLLHCLVSDENTRLTLTLEEIARRTQRSSDRIEPMLRSFVASRLVREIQEDEPWRYELMHEYLIAKINQATGRVMDATQRANRLLRQYTSNYTVDKATRVPIAKLWFIRRYADVERGERERELMKKSLRSGLIKYSALGLLLIIFATAVAAVLSVSEEWQATKLADGHSGAVLRTAFSPDGRLLVSVGEDSRVMVWDFARRERLATLTDHTDWVNTVAFSPDGKWFVTGSSDKTAIVWDAVRLEKVAVLGGHQENVSAVGFSPDGRLLVTIGNPAIVWAAGRWEKVRELPLGVAAFPTSIPFSPDGRRITFLTGEVWDLITGQRVSDAFNREWVAYAFSVSPDGTCIVNLDSDGVVRFIDPVKHTLLGSYRFHRFHGRAVAFSPDGKLLATCAEDIILWDAKTQTRLLRFEHTAQVWSVAFSPDGRWLVSGHDDGAILVWDVAEREQVASFNQHSASVRSVAFSPDGRKLASASEDRSIIIWDAESGQKEAVLVGHNTRVTDVAWSPDGKSLASCDQDSHTILWEVTERKLVWTRQYVGITKRLSPSYCLAFSPDGHLVANGNAVYESEGGRQVVDLQSISSRVSGSQTYGMAFSNDGRWLASLSYIGYIVLWDAVNWQVLEVAELKNAQLIALSFSPDDKWLVTGEDEGALRLWQTEPLREVAIIGRHATRIKSVAFSPDGSEIASSSDDQTIALWDVKSRSLITRIGMHTAPVISVAFSPDGKRLASGEHDRSVRIYTRRRSLWGYSLD